MFELFVLVFSGYLILVGVQTILWGIQLFTKDATTSDIGWAMGMVVLTVWYAVHLDGYLPRVVLALMPLMFWAVRLSLHITLRMVRSGQEDSRYAQFRQEWGTSAPFGFLVVYQIQPILNVCLSLPFLAICLNSRARISMLEIAALVVWVLGFAGEFFADRQLSRFVADPLNKGKICCEGWWAYSRHPNYFFEWVMWVAYALFGLASPQGAWGLISPVLMLFLLLKVSGIPFMEQRALQHKGDAFRDYARTTRMFFPLPLRRSV